MSRWASWFVSVAALALIGMSLGSYFHHRSQLNAIAARHLRVVVAGPAQLHSGAPAVYQLLTTRVTGEPWQVPVEWSLSTPDGKLVVHKEATDEQGRLAMTVPGDVVLAARSIAKAQLSVTAGESDRAASVTLPLSIHRPEYRTHLRTDRETYRPGETVYYRSLTVSRYGLAADATLPLEFEVLDAKSAPLPDSQWTGLTDRGVGNGSFRLPVSLAPGKYSLVARCGDDAFSQQRLEFEVVASASSSSPAKVPPADKVNEEKSIAIDFYPEGGALAVGLENRVYFFAHDGQGRPREIRGSLVNAKGDKLARLETSSGGRGRFSFSPDSHGPWRVQFDKPSGAESPSLLAAAPPNQKIAIAAVRSVVDAGSPLELLLRTATKDIPLVVVASAEGLPIGQELLVAPAESAKGTLVTVPLDERAAGIVRVAVYDFSASPPKTVAERLVFRRSRPLVVRVIPSKSPADDLLLAVENGKGQPVAAALGLTARRKAASASSPRSGRPQEDLLHALLLDGGAQDASVLDSLDLHAADTDSGAAAIDLALGCQRLAANDKPRATKQAVAAEASLPVVYDNLTELRDQYQARLSDYRQQRTQAVNALIMLGFFGGLALALLVTMLALLRIVWGGQLWLLTVVATLCCLVVTAVSNDPSRMQPVEVTAIGFAQRLPAEGEAATSSAVAAGLDGQLRRLAEKLAKYRPDADELKADYFPVQKYLGFDVGGAEVERNGKPLAWIPLLITGPDGRVSVSGISAAAAKNSLLMIEAHGDGRIESGVLSVK